jgi:hypothetical protein
MIIFELGCTQGHRFEGWFASKEDFGRQSDALLVRCPVCDDAKVAIVPSAKVQVAKAASAPVSAPAQATTAVAAAGQAATALPPELLRALREVIRATEDVGRRFPDEARKIHYDEAPARPIRGQATREEAAEMQEEGIELTTLPPFLTQDTH